MIWDGGSSTVIHDGKLSDRYTFKPANDLEWLAVNADEWRDDGCASIFKWDNGVCFHATYDKNVNCYTRKQWQSKRNELFGEKVTTKKMKVEYVKCEESISEMAKAMIDGETLYNVDGSKSIKWDVNAFTSSDGKEISVLPKLLFRRVETEVTWVERVVESMGEEMSEHLRAYGDDELGINTEFSSDEAIRLALVILEANNYHLVASMTDKPE